MGTRINDDMTVTHTMGKHDLESAMQFLRDRGYEIHASDSASERGKFVIHWKGPGARPEKLTQRELWFLVRGMRIMLPNRVADALT